jgi:hypothetical protein
MAHRHRFFVGTLAVVVLAAGLALIVLGGHGALAAPGIIYVDIDATGAKNGNSWKHAYTDLQPALEEAAAGDQIWVAAGTYKPTAEHGGTGNRYRSFQMKNGVAIYGGFDPSVGNTAWEDRDWVTHMTILSGDLNGDDGPDFENIEENSYHVFYHPDDTALDPTAVLDGFTISGGNADGTVGPHWFGGGMYNERSSPTLTNCTFRSNSANHGGGLYNRDGSSPTLTNCTFTGNSASSSGGGIQNHTSSPILIGCIFSGNSTVSAGGGMANAYSSPTLTNCTFSANSAVVYGGGISNHSSSPALTNCILWGNTPDEILNTDQASSPLVTYSDIQGGYIGDGNIDADPLFVEADGGDYRLGPSSPCIDAGSNDAPNLPLTDFEGDARVLDGDGDGTAIVDMGADEMSEEPPPPPALIFVDADATGNDTGTSWEDAFNDLQVALEAAASGDQIWVAEGTYTPSQELSPGDPRSATFQMMNEVAIYGGFAGTEHTLTERDWEGNVTILSGDLNGDDGPDFANNEENSYHVLLNSSDSDLNSTAILDGFTITGGSSTYAGGGMLNTHSSPTLTNVTFSGNWAELHGGGMYNQDSSPTLTNCTFMGNMAGTDGGGMVNRNSSSMLINCSFSGNAARLGGAMDNQYSSLALTNCTFSGNAASGGGGAIHNYSSSLRLTNCILWGDTSEIYNQNSEPIVTYSDVQGGYDGEGNIDVPPFFVDPANGDFHLRACSPCVDAGDNDAPDLPDYDFEGDDRILDGDGNGTATVDMGIDEAVDGLPCLHVYLPLVLKAY